MASSDIGTRMARIAREAKASDDVGDAVDRVCAAAVELLGRHVEAGVSIAHGSRRVESLGATSDTVRHGDKLQVDLGEGPCLDAVWDERQVVTGTLGTDPRWPRWGPRMAEEFGVHSMLCTQLFSDQKQLGALNLYSTRRDAFDEEDREVAQVLAVHATTTLASAQEIEGLQVAVDRRTVIGKALGIIMVKYDLDDERAFTVLKRLSSHENRKLYAVAEDVVATRGLPADT